MLSLCFFLEATIFLEKSWKFTSVFFLLSYHIYIVVLYPLLVAFFCYFYLLKPHETIFEDDMEELEEALREIIIN